MAIRFRNQQTKRKYAKISLKKRESLVELVINQGCGLTKTAKKLNLKLSTAKLILRKYKQTGKFHIRRTRAVPKEIHDVPAIKEEQIVSHDSEACSQNKGCQQPQFEEFQQNWYPIMYNEVCYPYFGLYGMWPIDNCYQFI